MNAAPTTCHITLPDPEATDRLGRDLASLLGSGDVLALVGPLGAGKSALARALIKARLAQVGLDEDVPSPSFTLVQSYQAGELEIWHCDLYRLSNGDEVLELGLEDAFETALALIEWPDRLGPDLPDHALTLTLSMRDDSGRDATLSWTDPAWTDRLMPLSKHAHAH